MADKIYRPSKTLDRDVYGDDVEKLIKTNRYTSCLSNAENVCTVLLVNVPCVGPQVPARPWVFWG